jgi:hypothetical protein
MIDEFTRWSEIFIEVDEKIRFLIFRLLMMREVFPLRILFIMQPSTIHAAIIFVWPKLA